MDPILLLLSIDEWKDHRIRYPLNAFCKSRERTIFLLYFHNTSFQIYKTFIWKFGRKCNSLCSKMRKEISKEIFGLFWSSCFLFCFQAETERKLQLKENSNLKKLLLLPEKISGFDLNSSFCWQNIFSQNIPDSLKFEDNSRIRNMTTYHICKSYLLQTFKMWISILASK